MTEKTIPSRRGGARRGAGRKLGSRALDSELLMTLQDVLESGYHRWSARAMADHVGTSYGQAFVYLNYLADQGIAIRRLRGGRSRFFFEPSLIRRTGK